MQFPYEIRTMFHASCVQLSTTCIRQCCNLPLRPAHTTTCALCFGFSASAVDVSRPLPCVCNVLAFQRLPQHSVFKSDQKHCNVVIGFFPSFSVIDDAHFVVRELKTSVHPTWRDLNLPRICVTSVSHKKIQQRFNQGKCYNGKLLLFWLGPYFWISNAIDLALNNALSA